MGKIIRGQVITTTELDLDGEQLSEEEITRLYEGLSDDLPMVVRHDMSTEPIARSFNRRLERLPNGDLAIKVDMEIFNEAEFAKFGGMSIGFSRHYYHVGTGEPLAAITLNTRQFDVNAAAADVQSALDGRFAVLVVERVEKAAVLTTAIIAIASFIAGQTFSGFFNAVGAELYALVKKLRRKDEPDQLSEVHFHLHLHESKPTPVVVLSVDPAATVNDVREINERPILNAISTAGGMDNLQRLVGRLHPAGDVEITYIVDSQGRPIRSTNPKH